MTIRIIRTYEPVRTHRTRTGRCPVCGKTVRRQRTFQQTINPFNRNPDGTVKTYDEVLAAAHAQADKWEPDYTHERCKQATP